MVRWVVEIVRTQILKERHNKEEEGRLSITLFLWERGNQRETQIAKQTP